jgi:acyl dehydratase
VPGHQAPFVVALVQLTEGVRMTGELLGVVPEQVRIGMPVRAEFVKVDGDLTLPAWRQAEKDASLYEADRSDTPPEAREAPQGRPPARGARKQSVLPELVIDVTPTFVIATAIATRDFQDVHHDRDKAVARGGTDIFINILTTTGLVQRYVTDWAGSDALVRKVDIRLGVPCYAGDTLTISGRVIQAGEGQHSGQDRVIEVVGRCGLGDHVTGTVRVCLPGGTP